jgi:hypothetical protein
MRGLTNLILYRPESTHPFHAGRLTELRHECRMYVARIHSMRGDCTELRHEFRMCVFQVVPAFISNQPAGRKTQINLMQVDCTELRHECRMYVFQVVPAFFPGRLAGRKTQTHFMQVDCTELRHECRMHVFNSSWRFFWPTGRPEKHKSISYRSIAQNLDTSVECLFFDLSRRFSCGWPAGRKINTFNAGRCAELQHECGM